MNLCLNQLRLFENTNDFLPHELVQIILADRPIGANRTTQMTIRIRAYAAVIVKFLLGGLRRTPIERIAALLAHQHSLQQGRRDSAPRRMALIVLQLLLRQGEGRITHQRRHGNLDPFWTRALSMRATTVAVSTSLPQGPCDFLTRRALRLAESCFALISRIAQHAPHRIPFPPRRSPAGWDSAIIQQAGDRIDAESLLGVRVEYKPNYICFRFDHFIISCRTVRLFHITIAVRRAREHVDGPLLRPMPFAAARTLDDLRPLVFRDHTLKLHHQLIFRRGTGRSLEKNQFHSLTVE